MFGFGRKASKAALALDGDATIEKRDGEKARVSLAPKTLSLMQRVALMRFAAAVRAGRVKRCYCGSPLGNFRVYQFPGDRAREIRCRRVGHRIGMAA